MPIIDVQRRLAEAGRIRAGQQVGTGRSRHPEKLQAWRFTSRNRRALEAVAQLYGGQVTEWADAPTGDQFELLSQAAEIDVVLPPEQVAFSQWLERWDAGGCKRRCDGRSQQPGGEACVCDPEQPKPKEDCVPVTRLSVMLAGAPTTGLWRVESHGHYAKSELLGAMDMADLLTRATGRAVLPAKLRLEHRKVVRDGKTKHFVVPTLDFAVDVAALAAGSTSAPALGPGEEGTVTTLPPGPSGVTPMAPRPTPSIAEQMADAGQSAERPRRANTPPPLPRAGVRPRTAREAAAADRGSGEVGQRPPPPASSDLETAKAAVNALLEPLPRELRQGYADTLREEHGDESDWTVETWLTVQGWLETELASVEGPGDRSSTTGPPPDSGPSTDDSEAPAFARDLHAKRQALSLDEETFRGIVSDVTRGRTRSTKELTNREAVAVMRRLVGIERAREAS